MSTHEELFDDLQQCPVCGEPLNLVRQVKSCPQGDIRFVLRKTTQRWYLSVEVPRSQIRIKETGELFDTQKDVAVHIGGHVSAVNECLHGKRKNCKGFTFEYAYDAWKLP